MAPTTFMSITTPCSPSLSLEMRERRLRNKAKANVLLVKYSFLRTRKVFFNSGYEIRSNTMSSAKCVYILCLNNHIHKYTHTYMCVLNTKIKETHTHPNNG